MASDDVDTASIRHIEQCDTPTRTRIIELMRFVKDFDLPIPKRRLFHYCGVSTRTGYRIIAANAEYRRHHNVAIDNDNRGRKRTIQQWHFEVIEDYFADGSFEERTATWKQLFEYLFPEFQAQYKLSERTIRRAFHDHGYMKCTACQKPMLTTVSLRQRQEYLRQRRDKDLSYWRRVRFSDEFHVGQGPKRKLKVIRKRGQRYHPDCIQKSSKKVQHHHKERYHCWFAVGYNFKSNLVFYNTNQTNGKMTQSVYMTNTLGGEVKRWISNGDDFILEEDQDSGHGPGGENQVKRYKEQLGLEYFFNASGSPDLSPVENCVRAIKQHIKDFDHYDDEAIVAGIRRAYDKLSIETINKYIDSMLQG